MICSILIPSRYRFDRLKRTIASLHSTSKLDNFEVLVGFDEDDAQAQKRHLELKDVRCFWSPRVADWDTGIMVWWNNLAEHATGEWLWPMSDDMEIVGRGWDEQLAVMPGNVWCQPEVHQLGPSIYQRDKGGPVPVLRRNFWLQNKFPLMDKTIWEACMAAGLELKWLAGITVRHQRDDDTTLAKHRQR